MSCRSFPALLFVAIVMCPPVTAQVDSLRPITLSAGLTISAFQQQVKTEVGGETGDPLANDFQLGLLLSGTYRFTDYLSAGLYVRLDRGERRRALFAGFDENDAALVQNQVGGTYTELWFGPLLQFSWKLLRLDLGYGLIGSRSDKGRNDLPAADGDTSGAFSTSPTVAWLFALGADVPLSDRLDVVFKVEYRLRYYTERGGEPILPQEVEHGTQSIAPVIGLAYRF